MLQDQTIVLHTFIDMLEAKMIQDRLQANGIIPILADKNIMDLDAMSRAELKIFEKTRKLPKKLWQSNASFIFCSVQVPAGYLKLLHLN